MKRRFLKFLSICSLICSFLFVLTACKESPISFKVNFIVDGEIVKTIDTAGNEKISLPENPAKENYTFDGWFWDKDTWQKPFTANSLLDAPLSSDMSVYAKFTKIHEHNYTAAITEPTCLEKGYTTHTCDCGDSYIDDYVDELGHTPAAAAEENRQEPKCEINGGYDIVIYCKTCGAELSREHKIIAALQHEFTDYTPDNNATYDNDGTKTARCNHGCGATDTITDVGTKLQSGIAFKTLTLDSDNNVYGKVPNTQTTFSFINEIDVSGNAEYFVSSDIYGINQIPTKTVPLSIGNNTFYVTETVDNNIKLFTVTVKRKLIYNVTFNTDGGTPVEPQKIEEDGFAAVPTTTRAGYTFTEWNYQFDEPITDDTAITAIWSANTNTPYKVEYYLENLEDNDYTLEETVNLTGTTDTTAYAEIKTFEHFTPTASEVGGNIDGDGNKVLKVYYSRNKYTVVIQSQNEKIGVSSTYNGSYKYGYQTNGSNLSYLYLGYDFAGWYNGGELISTDEDILPFIVDKNIHLVATCTVKDEMKFFNFSSTTTTCSITGIKDKTLSAIIVPDYVTEISQGVFSGCSSLESLTIPFVGAKAGVTASDNYQYPLGYIFGTSSFTGGTATKQSYYGGSTNSTTTSTYYIPNSLRSVTVNGGNILRGAFFKCSGLTSVTIGNSVTSIGVSAFYNCSGLTSIAIGNSVTSIGGLAFYNCSGLTSITIPNSVTSIGNYAFYNCSSLTSVTIPNSVTSIGNDAFSGCSSLTSITIPNSVTSIGNGAFYGCSSLTSIKFNDTTTWYMTTDYSGWQNKTGGTEMSVTNVSTNATYFKSTYYNYYCYKL